MHFRILGRMRVALLVLLSVGCAQSEIPDDFTSGGDTGTEAAAADTGGAKTDTGTAADTTVEDTGSADTDPGADSTPASDSEFPDFGGGGDSTMMFPDGGFGTTCAMDGDCKSPFNCCELTKKVCGFKFGPSCMTF